LYGGQIVNDESLQRELIRIYTASLTSVTRFVRLLDSPGMTIDALRSSPEANALRDQQAAMRKWMIDAIDNTKCLPPEERDRLRGEFGEGIKTDRRDAESAETGGVSR
jgi:hypothetical protein